MANILDLAGYVHGMGEQGRQRGERTYLGKLMGQAYQTDDPAQQRSLLGQIAQVAPEAAPGFARSQGDDRQQRMAALGQKLNYFVGQVESGNQAVVDSMYPGLAQETKAMGFGDVPLQFNPAFLPGLKKAAEAFGGAAARQNLTPSVASVEDAFRRGIISKEEYDKGMRIALDLAPGASAPSLSYIDEFDPATGRTYRRAVQTRGVDYTGDLPSIGGDRQPAPAGAPPVQERTGSAPPSYADRDPEAVKGDVEALVRVFGGQITSGYRDPARNAAVGGVPNSQHMRGTGFDAVFPTPQAKQAAIAQARAMNYEAIDEGDHVHFELPPGGAPAVAGGPAPAPGVGGGGSAPGGAVAPPARPADPFANSPYLRTNITDVGGGGRILSGPGYAEQEAQKRREAAAGAEGAIEGRRNMGPDFTEESSLRKEFSDLTKEPRVVIDAFRKVREAATNDSAAGDLSLIFAYMKMLDPNSVVRETEFANAQNAAGVPDQIRNAWNRAMTGERLGAPQRADFVRQAESIAQLAQARIDEATERYRGMAPDYNMNPDRIAPAGDAPPVQGAKKAPDGNWYVQQDGKWFKVES